MEFITDIMGQYGYLVLLLSLCLGILALPLPIEAIMGYAGLLAYQSKLNWFLCILAAGIGGYLGMAIAYWIGYKLGMPFFERYGKRIHLGPDRIQQTSKWFNRYGNKLLIVSYFIPGVRHFTGYFAGITRLPFKTYSIYAISGSFIWVSSFILLGKMLGPNWHVFHESISKYLVSGSITVAVVMILIFVIKKKKQEIVIFGTALLGNVLGFFKTRRRFRLFIVVTSVLTLIFLILMVGVIQDYLSNEFYDFDVVATMLVTVIFTTNDDAAIWMNLFGGLGASGWLILMIFATFVWIYFKGKDRGLEIYLLIITLAGGEIYDDILRSIFHRLAPDDLSLIDRFSDDFPSGHSLMAFVIYGYLFFVLLRHSKNVRTHSLLVTSWILILLFIAISRVYFGTEAPSQIAAGYVFGGVWLGISILMLELFRILRKV